MSKNRYCYCGSLSKEFLEKEGIPDGYCGICERCGKPGHTQHFPGPVPYTGSWCDWCVKVVALFYWIFLAKDRFVTILKQLTVTTVFTVK